MTEPAPLPDLWAFLQRAKVAPFGIPTAQHWYHIAAIFHMIDELHIRTFIELGVYYGGLSDLLIRRERTVKDIAYFGFDWDPQYLPISLRYNPAITIGDVFDTVIVEQVSNLIQAGGSPALVFCDDGDKPREMRTYAPVLRVGDYLVAHDYPETVTDETLAEFAVEVPYMLEIDPPIYRGLGLPLWRRNA